MAKRKTIQKRAKKRKSLRNLAQAPVVALSRFIALVVLVSFSLPLHAKTRIVFLGDSLTDGYGVAQEMAYPKLVETALNKKGHDVEVINAGISGSTSASGVSRLKWILKKPPDIVLLSLGGNDGLRGFDLAATEKNLLDTIALAKEKKVKVILAGMQIPLNYGEQYRKDFNALFPRVAKKMEIPLIPFLLEGVGGLKEMNLSDGIHPNEKGHQKISETVLPHLERLL